MGSTNKHWPSLFKSKPTCASAHHHQRQHEINQSSILSGHCQKPSIYTSGTEKTPEQKPRWNPKPEQIQILESIFNSGMVNPPRDEICRIRDQLQVYGQVGDANVFYWFQNRKSRSKHKQRHLKSAAARSNSKPCSAPAIVATVPPPPTKTTSSSSSSSDHSSSGSDKQILSFTAPKQLSPGNLSTFFDLPDTLVHAPVMKPELGLGAPTFLPTISSTYANLSNEFIAGIEAGTTSLWSGLLVQGFTRKDDIPENGLEMLAVLGSVTDASLPPAFAPNYITTTTAAHATFNDMEEVTRSTVFIDEVAYEVMAKPLNIKEAFGENTVLVHSSGHPVLTDESGLTLRPLDHGSSYYLLQVQ